MVPPSEIGAIGRRLWFSSAGQVPATPAARRKVENADVTQALAAIGDQVRYNQLREKIMNLTKSSKRTAQLAIAEACQQGWIVQTSDRSVYQRRCAITDRALCR